jgi:hypothetical protein
MENNQEQSVLPVPAALAKKLEREAAKRKISMPELLTELAEHGDSGSSNPGNPGYSEEEERRLEIMSEAVRTGVLAALQEHAHGEHVQAAENGKALKRLKELRGKDGLWPLSSISAEEKAELKRLQEQLGEHAANA